MFVLVSRHSFACRMLETLKKSARHQQQRQIRRIELVCGPLEFSILASGIRSAQSTETGSPSSYLANYPAFKHAGQCSWPIEECSKMCFLSLILKLKKQASLANEQQFLWAQKQHAELMRMQQLEVETLKQKEIESFNRKVVAMKREAALQSSQKEYEARRQVLLKKLQEADRRAVGNATLSVCWHKAPVSTYMR